MHVEAYNWVKLCRENFDVGANDRVLEIGSYNHNGTVRDFFQNMIYYVGVDIIPGPCVDLVGDINNEQFRNVLMSNYKGFNTIISTETLEHTPWKPLVYSMLSLFDYDIPVQRLIITCAGKDRVPHSFDGLVLKENEYYGNVDAEELRAFVEESFLDFVDSSATISVVVETNEHSKDTYLFAEVSR